MAKQSLAILTTTLMSHHPLGIKAMRSFTILFVKIAFALRVIVKYSSAITNTRERTNEQACKETAIKTER